MNTRTRQMLQWATLVVLAVGAAYAGLRFGRSLGGGPHEQIVDAPDFPWKPGDAFPDVRVADSLGVETGTADLVGMRHGAVVLFLDPNCEGCSAMAERWERGLAEGVIEPERVFAISDAPAAENARYRAAHALSYPIFRDVQKSFLNDHGVVTYPMEVVVGASGNIEALSTDSKTPIDGESIRTLIEH